MKIIKEGKKVIGTLELTCPKCEAVLELYATDLQPTGFKNMYEFICPCCSRTHLIARFALPEDVRFDLEHLQK